MAEEEDHLEIKIEEIMGTLNNMEGGRGKLIVGLSKAMEDINDLILKHRSNDQPFTQETLNTMFTIVGREVDLHTKIGDVYRGILYLASVKTDIVIQLKRCNLGNGFIVDTKDIALNEISKIVARGVTVLVDNLDWNLLKMDDEKDKQSNTNYQIDIQKIVNGEDTRTSLMIRNIPKGYTSEMLISEINDTQPGTFDFFYHPVKNNDRNKNVGYAFINFVAPSTPKFHSKSSIRYTKKK